MSAGVYGLLAEFPNADALCAAAKRALPLGQPCQDAALDRGKG